MKPDLRVAVWCLLPILLALVACKGKKQEEYVKALKADLPPSCSYFPSDVVLTVECADEAGLDKLKDKFEIDCAKIKAAGWTVIRISTGVGATQKVYSAGSFDPIGNCVVK